MNGARLAGWALIVLALVFVGQIAWNELSGETEVPRKYLPSPYDSRLKKADNPAQFRSIITFKWYRALACIGGGVILFAIARRADRLDPFAPDAGAKPPLDGWYDTPRKPPKPPGE